MSIYQKITVLLFLITFSNNIFSSNQSDSTVVKDSTVQTTNTTTAVTALTIPEGTKLMVKSIRPSIQHSILQVHQSTDTEGFYL
jgi:hypothetical protein